MRRKWLILLGCVSGALQAFAQKSVLDTSVLYQWPSVEEKGILSPDGKYAGYVVYDNFTRQRRPTYFIKATSSSWEKQLPDVEKVDFTADSRKAVYLDSAMLHILSLGTAEVERIPHISTYQLIKMNGEGYLLYYSETERRLSVRGKSMLESYSDVDRWLLSTDGRVLLKITKQREDRQLVTRIELETKDEKIIWDGRPVKDCMMDDGGRQAVFTVTDQSGQDYICYYKAGEEKARPIVDAGNSLIDKTISVGKLLKFSKDGDRLFFNLKEPRSLRRESKLVSVDVWSYRDPKLQSQQLQEDAPQKERNYLAVVDLNGKFTVLRLQLEAEGPGKFSPDGNYVVFDEARGERSEQGWSAAAQYKYDLVDSRSGKRKEIGRFHLIDFSPAGRFLDLIHPETHETYTYEIATGVIRPLTSTAPLTHKAPNGEGRNLTTFHGLMSVTGWLPGDHTVLVQDYYDLWELDPLGKRAPLCLTHRQGVKTKTTFAIAMDERRGVIMDDTLLLSAFDHNTKDNGFYRIVLHKEQVPGKLTMGPYFYSMRFSSLPWQQPVKAENAEIYLLRRQSISESPNYFVTGDFRTFNPVSALYPEKKYNWTRSRLIAFKTTDGRDEQGVLYMPEDFDPGKKYPLIFH
ncbi:MAG: hypothetical protein Q8932_05895, partial [Bacteroidota bacterium]|nr:hypothetical protein [Bacteroidota bacterium]